jgi:hypothetical protein
MSNRLHGRYGLKGKLIETLKGNLKLMYGRSVANRNV